MNNVRKPIPIPTGARIKEYFDTSAVITSELATYSLFPSVAQSGDFNANYSQNPFPGQFHRLVTGIRIEPTSLAFRTEANVNPYFILNRLAQGSILLRADQDRKQMVWQRLTDFLDLQNIATAPTATDDGTNYTVEQHVTLKPGEMKQIADPFIISPNQVLSLDLSFKSVAGLPTGAQWAAATANVPLQLAVTVQVIELNDAQLEVAMRALGLI